MGRKKKVQADADSYMAKHKIMNDLTHAMQELIHAKPPCPHRFLADYFLKLASGDQQLKDERKEAELVKDKPKAVPTEDGFAAYYRTHFRSSPIAESLYAKSP